MLDPVMDNPGNLTPEAMLHRLQEPQVAYREISGSWGEGGCGGCRFFAQGFCVNTSVMSYVSGEAGMCNFFDPDEAEFVDHHDWKALDEMDYDPLKGEEDAGEMGSVNEGGGGTGKGDGEEGEEDEDEEDDDEDEED